METNVSRWITQPQELVTAAISKINHDAPITRKQLRPLVRCPEVAKVHARRKVLSCDHLDAAGGVSAAAFTLSATVLSVPNSFYSSPFPSPSTSLSSHIGKT
ncbi:hypothetical protein EGR_10792 [Echinococcus granulosus]|uniref:Uncharacterized protein n=1 Tax=Echinococcus granulosus TaxID=6210 RepID=W6U1F4_ECHGR|nr:hypothetical protein EGR_10792 [Echinococcus granulosus]EUB54346.1 hypothetical protein EGR_10792 [Echinococcus granulosus]